ncbi:NAD-dependent epimerase/dehydratase family protein [Synechococcus sp. MIT S1220]|uniref:NAD-dependent epimerase/dehydratase family protein n=1 Tax=Synechococcus sp. MIT S1220 TaxID=3082549 RepID=UPI0039AF9390
MPGLTLRLTIVGCGYVGMALACELQSHRTTTELTLTTTSEGRLEELKPLAEQVQICSAQNPKQLYEALSEADVAVFCLGPKGDRQVDAGGYRQTFLDSLNCLKQLLPALPKLGQIVYTSSCSVYGDAAGDWVDETTPVQAHDDHSAVLLEVEDLLQNLAETPSKQVCILRLAALHGPGRDLDQRFRGLAGQNRAGDGQRFTNWVHVADAAGALRASIEKGWSGVVNVVNDEPIRLADLVDGALRRQGLAPIRWGGEAHKSGCNRRISNRRLKQRGYQLQHPAIVDQRGVLDASQVP